MGQLKYHNGTTWVPIEDGVSDYSAFVINDVLSGAINGTNRVFTTTRNFASISLYVNGVKQNPGVGNDYQVTGANQVTFEVGSEPATGSVVTADFTTSSSYTVTGTNSFVRKQAVTGLVNGTNKVYTTAQPYVGGTLEVFINGLRQGLPHLVETNPATGTFTMDEAPITDDNVEVAYMVAGVPSGNADTVDTFHASQTPAGNTIPVSDANGNLSGVSVGTSYSTSETITGATWIDGKAIYKKTISIGALPNTANKNTAHNITGLTAVLRWEGVGIGSGPQAGVYIDLTQGNGCNTYVNSTNVIIATSISRSEFAGYVTLYYTK